MPRTIKTKLTRTGASTGNTKKMKTGTHGMLCEEPLQVTWKKGLNDG